MKDINVTTVSIDPVEDLSIEIYPIPANDYIQVKSNDSGREYKIFNSEGKLVKAGIVSQNDKIDIKNLMSGFYKLQLAHSSSSKYVTKQFEVLK
ncbi:MAG: T9SS type A sorting domain-containing protein [Saprospiraceae bacterium]|nr:T9SS type A sorting domain-containing protein [Saprospiraceae bacterium]